MMDMTIPRAWREEFAIAAELHREQIRQREKIEVFEALDQQARDKHRAEEKKAEKKRQEEREALDAALATPEQIGDFRLRLDDYDTKTVSALMDNGEALDGIDAKLKEMLDRAYILPDGRHAFKTADGQRVFDEHGAEVSKLIDPALIENGMPKWEAFKADKDTKSKLEDERNGLLEFQTKVDAARMRLDKGTISSKELDDLGADLKASLPPSLRQKPDQGTPQMGVTAKPRPDDPSPATVPVTGTDDPARRVGPRPAPM